MQPNIKELFSPLARRLYYYDSENYLNRLVKIHNIDESSFDFTIVMNQIGENIDIFPLEDIYIETSLYKMRIENLLKIIKPREEVYERNVGRIIRLVKTSKEEQELQTDMLTGELNYYLEQLQIILNTRLPLINKSKLKKLQLEQSTKLPVNNNPKIQWLGKTNLLGTLFFDLLYGQDNGKKEPSTTPLISAQKKDLEQLLLNNFIDAKRNPLKPSTISDYLNTSKPEKRVKNGLRIKLPIK